MKILREIVYAIGLAGGFVQVIWIIVKSLSVSAKILLGLSVMVGSISGYWALSTDHDLTARLLLSFSALSMAYTAYSILKDGGKDVIRNWKK